MFRALRHSANKPCDDPYCAEPGPIPARAGEPGSRLSWIHNGRAYPRAGGGTPSRTSAASSAPSSSVPRSRGLNRTQSFGTGGEPPSGGEPSSARIRHQVDCGWAQTPANVSEVTAGARTSQTCAGEGQSHRGVSGRRAGGGDRADPVFHPNNEATHSSWNADNRKRPALPGAFRILIRTLRGEFRMLKDKLS